MIAGLASATAMRGSAVSIALLHEGEPVLGVVYSPLSPNDDGDLIAWAEGCPLARNGRALDVDLRQASLDRGSFVFLSQDADRNPEANARLLGAGVRYRSMPSIAYRLALVAAGEGVAATSLNGPVSWDYAAGHALLRGAGACATTTTYETAEQLAKASKVEWDSFRGSVTLNGPSIGMGPMKLNKGHKGVRMRSLAASPTSLELSSGHFERNKGSRRLS